MRVGDSRNMILHGDTFSGSLCEGGRWSGFRRLPFILSRIRMEVFHIEAGMPDFEERLKYLRLRLGLPPENEPYTAGLRCDTRDPRDDNRPMATDGVTHPCN